MKKENFIYNKVIALICIAAGLFVTGIILNSLPERESNVEAAAGYLNTQPVNFINSSNVDVIEQDISYLRGDSPLRLKDGFDIKLSHNNFFYTDSIDVEITTEIPDAKIFYSIDGSTPTPENGKEYTKPVFLVKGGYNTSYVLKVMAYTDDDVSHLLTHTYFVSDRIDTRFTTFVFAISTDRDNLYGYENGILIEGKLRDDFIAERGSRRDINPPDPANFNIRGSEGEREAYIEVFNPNGECIISQNGGIRVHGGWSRAANKKSLKIYARNEYDPDFDKFNYEFFPGNRRKDEYQSFINSYSSLLLRNGGNDREGSMMREELCQVLAKEAGFLDSKNAAPACIFLNGEYYGFFWLQETYNDEYFFDYYGGDGKSLFEIGEWGEPDAGDLTDDENFLTYSELMDIDNYMFYYAFQIYSGNRDWPHNNLKYWRFNGDGTYINQYFDGKFRMLLYDVEMAWGMYGAGHRERTIQRIIRDRSSRSFVAFMRRDDMVEKFCNQMFDLINTVFKYDFVEKNFDMLVDLYSDELDVAVRARVINDWMRMGNVRNEQRNILKFAESRADAVIDDMTKTFDLAEDIYYVNVSGNANAKIALNTLMADGAAQLKSCYFAEHSIILKAEAYPGYSFDYWEINGQKYYDAELTLNSSAKFVSNGQINAVLYIKGDEAYKMPVINILRLDDDFDYIELYNPGVNEIAFENLYLSNSKNELQKFKIETLKLQPKSVVGYYGANYLNYLNDLNDNADEKEIDDENIFNFKVAKGETIYLSDIDGNILQELKTTKNINEAEIIKRLSDGSYKIFKAE